MYLCCVAFLSHWPGTSSTNNRIFRRRWSSVSPYGLPLRHTNRRVFCDITSILVTLTILRTLWWSYSSVHWDGCSDNIDESIWVGIFGISNDLQFNKIEMSISSKKKNNCFLFSFSHSFSFEARRRLLQWLMISLLLFLKQDLKKMSFWFPKAKYHFTKNSRWV